MKLIQKKDFTAIAHRVGTALSGLNWCLIGGRAVEFRSNPPQTPDMDILVSIRPNQKAALIERMEDVGFVLDVEFWDEGYAPMLFFVSHKPKYEVDIIAAFEAHHGWAIERAESMKIGALRIPVATAEDLVLLKTEVAIDPARGKDKAKRDMAAIQAIANENELDVDYIESALSMMGRRTTAEQNLLRKLGIL